VVVESLHQAASWLGLPDLDSGDGTGA
jgi:hypothetical protein